jgi:glutamine synthetase
MILAGPDGVQNLIEPPDPVDKDLYDHPPEELALVPQVPASLEAALNALENDNDFLTVGGVFTPDLIETWIEYKTVHELDEVRLRPHPWEFALYYDI